MLCSEMSRTRDEPLAGTAVHAPVILAVEETGAWAPKAIDSPGLDGIRDSLAKTVERLGARLQLIRKSSRPCEPKLRRVYLFDAGARALRSFDLGDEAFATLDDAPINTNAGVHSPSLYLVCTHGRRDRCCALEGGAYYRAHAEREDVWMTSHLGGHRFAATMLCLPSGLCYGRLSAQDSDLEALPSGLLRGRVAYEPAVQRAEIALMESTGLGQWRLSGTQRENDESQLVSFVREQDSDEIEYSVVVRPMKQAAHVLSCGDEPKAISLWSAEEPRRHQ